MYMYYACIPTITRETEHDMETNFHQSTSLAEPQKALEAHGCKPWVTNLPFIPDTLGTCILPTNITYCIMLLQYMYVNVSQVNTHTYTVVQLDNDQVHTCTSKRKCSMNRNHML